MCSITNGADNDVDNKGVDERHECRNNSHDDFLQRLEPRKDANDSEDSNAANHGEVYTVRRKSLLQSTQLQQ